MFFQLTNLLETDHSTPRELRPQTQIESLKREFCQTPENPIAQEDDKLILGFILLIWWYDVYVCITIFIRRHVQFILHSYSFVWQIDSAAVLYKYITIIMDHSKHSQVAMIATTCNYLHHVNNIHVSHRSRWRQQNIFNHEQGESLFHTSELCTLYILWQSSGSPAWHCKSGVVYLDLSYHKDPVRSTAALKAWRPNPQLLKAWRRTMAPSALLESPERWGQWHNEKNALIIIKPIAQRDSELDHMIQCVIYNLI